MNQLELTGKAAFHFKGNVAKFADTLSRAAEARLNGRDPRKDEISVADVNEIARYSAESLSLMKVLDCLRDAPVVTREALFDALTAQSSEENRRIPGEQELVLFDRYVRIMRDLYTKPETQDSIMTRTGRAAFQDAALDLLKKDRLDKQPAVGLAAQHVAGALLRLEDVLREYAIAASRSPAVGPDVHNMPTRYETIPIPP